MKDYLLVAIHLEDRRNYKTADRVETIRHLVADIKKTEELLKMYKYNSYWRFLMQILMMKNY